MADLTSSNDTVAPTTPEVFLDDRRAFWHSFTRFTTIVAGGIIVLLLLLDYFLVH